MLAPTLRAAENAYPAYCIYDNVKYFISAYPEVPPAFPEVTIKFPSLDLIETWHIPL